MNFSTKLILVILYKCSIENSSTIKSLITIQDQYKKNKLIIWDNSPVGQQISKVEQLEKVLGYEVEYKYTPENISLSKIYNSVVQNNKGYGFLLLFDQDSFFTKDYFDKIDIYSKEYENINLFVPLIKHKSVIISPGSFSYFKGKFWKKEKVGKIKAKNTLAITSGMAIRGVYLNDFGEFDENLKLYGIDTNFMIRYWRQNKYLYVFKTFFDHDLSDFNKEKSGIIKNQRFEDKIKAEYYNLSLFSKPVLFVGRLYLKYKIIKNKIING